MKIAPHYYPLIIIIAFIIGTILAMAFGFRPQHGSGEKNGHGQHIQAQIQTVELWSPTLT
jgi:hypothetical protein